MSTEVTLVEKLQSTQDLIQRSQTRGMQATSLELTTTYLTTDCQLSSEEGRRQLRSADSRTCVVRQTYSNFGDPCFVAVGKWTSAMNSLSGC